jgi:hypothetical protein
MRVELNLPIERKWFDMIARGEKKEEYRDCEHRQVQRFYLWASNCDWWSEYDPVVIFRNGYTMQSRALVARITGGDLRGRESVKHPEWGEPRCRRLHLVVQLGEILYRGTYAQVKEYIKQHKETKQDEDRVGKSQLCGR